MTVQLRAQESSPGPTVSTVQNKGHSNSSLVSLGTEAEKEGEGFKGGPGLSSPMGLLVPRATCRWRSSAFPDGWPLREGSVVVAVPDRVAAFQQ